MFAVIKTGGKQYSVESGKTLKIERIVGKKGDIHTFKNVLIIGEPQKQILGTPEIEGASVDAEVVAKGKDKKIVILKFKAKTRYRRKNGHRQHYTDLRVTNISSG